MDDLTADLILARAKIATLTARAEKAEAFIGRIEDIGHIECKNSELTCDFVSDRECIVRRVNAAFARAEQAEARAAAATGGGIV